MTWLIELQGEPIDLEEFPRNFPSGPIHAVNEGEKVFVTGSYFDQFNEPGAVQREAMSIIEAWTGVASLDWPSLRMPAIGGIKKREQGKPDTQYVLLTGLEARSKVSAHLTVLVDGEVQPTGLTRAQIVQNASDSSPHLKASLQLWARRPKSWSDLYRIAEELREHLGQDLAKAGHCSANMMTRFRQCCQSHDVAGLDARHRIGYTSPPQDPMSLEEATAFVGGLLKSVVAQLRPQ